MSDDDCDIFSAARKRIPEIALPKESYNLGNDSFSKEVDYDFIEDLPKKSTKIGKRKNHAATRENPPKSQEDASPPKQAGEQEKDARKERSLSPVSLLILEMDAKEYDVGPVARRTRSSLNKTGIAPPSPPPVSATVEVPTQVKPKKRGKKKRTSLTTTTNNSVSVEASLPSIVGHLYQNKDHTSRRQTVAEVAARSKVVDSIDLVSAVAPRVEGFFNLDSEDEGEEEAPPVVEEENIFDNDNPTIEVALSWLGEIQIYKLRQHQKFKHLFKELASRNGLDENDITVDMYYNFVGPEDTPHSIGLKSFHTLTGHLTKSQNNNHVAAKNDYNPEALCRKPKKFQVKVQADKWKYPLVIPMKKTDNFKILFIKCAEELNCDPRSIKLFFDGDLLDPNDTPNNQDMEGNEVIDLKIKA